MLKTNLSPLLVALCIALTSCLSTQNTPGASDREPGPPQVPAPTEGKQVSPPTPLLPDLVLEAGAAPAQVRTGQEFSSPFSATVIHEAAGTPAEGIIVTVSYPEGRLNDDVTFATTTLTTDGQGLVTFTPPSTDFTCDSQITFSVESKTGTKSVSVPYKVRTDRHNKGGTISIVDYTKDGTPVRDNSRSASALLTAFLRNGFSNVGLIDFVNEIHSGNQQRVYQAAKDILGNGSNFFVYGTVKYNGDIVRDGSTYTIPLVGDIICLDMKSGRQLYHTVVEVVGTGGSEWAALDNARNGLYGPEAAKRIIYGM